MNRKEWESIQELIGSDTGPDLVAELVVEAAEQIRAKSQGISVSPAIRKAVEVYAMQKATVYFEKKGYAVHDVSKHQSYDLRCVRGDEVLYVEVKGTKTAGEEILLTPGEVGLARRKFPHTALFIVHSVKVLETDDPPTVTGGRVRLVPRWNPDDSRLKPLGYSYELPKE